MASDRQTGRALVLNNFTKWSSFLLALLILSITGATLMATDSSLIVELLHEPEFGRAVLFSLHTSVIATLLAAITAVPAGLYLARNKTFFTHIIDALFDIPIVMPPLVVGVLLLSFFNLELIKTVYNFIFTTSGAVIAQFFVAMPFTVRASKNTFELISPDYEQMAMTLGATPARAFYDTTMRMAVRGITAGLILSWLRCLGEFGATLMVGGAIPGRTENVPIYIYLSMSGGEFDKGVAASVIALLCAFLGVLLMKYIVNRTAV
jgi:molybdate transport system permease protein